MHDEIVRRVQRSGTVLVAPQAAQNRAKPGTVRQRLRLHLRTEDQADQSSKSVDIRHHRRVPQAYRRSVRVLPNVRRHNQSKRQLERHYINIVLEKHSSGRLGKLHGVQKLRTKSYLLKMINTQARD